MKSDLDLAGVGVSTAEVERVLASHPGISEVAVVVSGVPDCGGQPLTAFITLKDRVVESEGLKLELAQLIRETLGPSSVLEKIHFTTGLPKSRSGKIMRYRLEEIADGE
jgi:acetyl-CoA synthetase